MSKKFVGKNQKKSKKKLSEIIRKIINNTCIHICVYDILAIFDQSWKKKEDRKKIEKYFKSSCLRGLKTLYHNSSRYLVDEL